MAQVQEPTEPPNHMSATRVKTITAAMRGNPDWQAVLDLILKEFNCQTGTLHKWHELHAMLELICHRGIPRELMNKIERIPMGKGIAGAAAERMEPVSMCNLQSDTSGVARPKAKKTSVGGNIAVPIDMGGLLMGTLGIGKLEPYEFTPEETKDLLQIAAQIADHWVG
jgi:signal transduction protein with GAF and PtsI domain